MESQGYKLFIRKLEEKFGAYNARQKTFEEASQEKVFNFLRYDQDQVDFLTKLLSGNGNEEEYSDALRRIFRAYLIPVLEQKYGRYDWDKGRFKKANRTSLAQQLFYTNGQITKLLNATGNVGEEAYNNAIRNVEESIKKDELEKKISQLEVDKTQFDKKKEEFLKVKFWRFLAFILLLAFIMCLIVKLLIIPKFFAKEIGISDDQAVMEQTFPELYGFDAMSFETSSNLPCYAYQGKFELDSTYVWTFPGIDDYTYYYRADRLDMYSRCKAATEGQSLEAFSFLVGVIWYKPDEKKVKNYKNLLGTGDPIEKGFVKVGEVSAIFKDVIDLSYSPTEKKYLPAFRTGVQIRRLTPSYFKRSKIYVVDRITDKVEHARSITPCEIQIDSSQVSSLINPSTNILNEGAIIIFDCNVSLENKVTEYDKRIKFITDL